MGGKRVSTQVQGVTLDAGALLALERADERMIALVRRAATTRGEVRVPAGALAQVWRKGARQSRLAALLGSPQVRVVPLDEALARASGELCGARGTSDVIDASVVLTARLHRDLVVTSDPDDLHALDPSLAILRI